MGAQASSLLVGGGDELGSADRGGRALPPMVLVVEAVLWRGVNGNSNGGDACTGSPSFAVAPSSSRVAMECGPPSSASSLAARVGSGGGGGGQRARVVSVAINGREVGRAADFPSGPVRLVELFGGSNSARNPRLSLRVLETQAANGQRTRREVLIGGVECTLADLTRYGAPLLASIWLGLPTIDEPPGKARTINLSEALRYAQDPEMPKLVISVMRPLPPRPRPPPANGELGESGELLSARSVQGRPSPDIAAALAEDGDFCLGPRGASGEGFPSGVEQVQGLLEALAVANDNLLRLQQVLFNQPDPRTRRLDSCENNDVPKLEQRSLSTRSLRKALLEDAVQQQHQRLVKEVERLQAELEEARSAERQAQNSYGNLQQELSRKAELEASKEVKLLSNTGELDVTTLKEDTAQHKSVLQQQQQESARLREETARLREELDALRTQQGHQNDRRQLQEELAQVRGELEASREAASRRSISAEAATAEVSRLHAELDKSQLEISGLGAELKAVRAEVQERLQALHAESATLTEEAHLGKEAEKAMAEDISRLREECQLLQARAERAEAHAKAKSVEALWAKDDAEDAHEVVKAERLQDALLDEQTRRKESEEELRRLHNAFEFAKEQQTVQYTLLEEIRQERDQLHAELEETKDEVDSLQRALQAAADVRHELEGELTECRARAAASEQELELHLARAHAELEDAMAFNSPHSMCSVVLPRRAPSSADGIPSGDEASPSAAPRPSEPMRHGAGVLPTQ